jgi:hypothetical protein
MITLSIGSKLPSGDKTPHCYHLVAIESARPMQHFVAIDGAAVAAPATDSVSTNVLALFVI